LNLVFPIQVTAHKLLKSYQRYWWLLVLRLREYETAKIAPM